MALSKAAEKLPAQSKQPWSIYSKRATPVSTYCVLLQGEGGGGETTGLEEKLVQLCGGGGGGPSEIVDYFPCSGCELSGSGENIG